MAPADSEPPTVLHRYLGPMDAGVTCPNPGCACWLPAGTDRCTACGTDIPEPDDDPGPDWRPSAGGIGDDRR